MNRAIGKQFYNLIALTIMKAKRFMFLVMAICLANGVAAQFYDEPDDIYYYLEDSEDGLKISKERQYVYIFNFDGKKACKLGWNSVSDVQNNLSNNPNYYVDKEETSIYNFEYESSSYGICYTRDYKEIKHMALFSSDRETLNYILWYIDGSKREINCKKVDKSFFRLGRSRSPSGTMYK